MTTDEWLKNEACKYWKDSRRDEFSPWEWHIATEARRESAALIHKLGEALDAIHSWVEWAKAGPRMADKVMDAVTAYERWKKEQDDG